MSLSQYLSAFPAKTTITDRGDCRLGISVEQHCLLSAFVLKCLVAVTAFREKGRVLPEELPLVAAVHDIGKLSPGFLKKLLAATVENDSAVKMWTAVLEPYAKATIENHAYTGACAMRDLLEEDSDVARFVIDIVGGHHGYFQPFDAKSVRHIGFGGVDWQAVRAFFTAKQKGSLGIADFPLTEWSVEMRNAWLGLVVVADWIASQIVNPVKADLAQLAGKLTDQAGFSRPFFKKGLSFEDLFEFAPSGLQKGLSDIYQGPGVYVIEAPTGSGKTEAALWLAYRALIEGDASGVYFALPTQLTSNRLFARFSKAIEKMLIPEARVPSVRLIHSASRLALTSMGGEAGPDGDWFRSNRRAILAPFAVGTVDQALLSVLNVKFAAVRSAGLIGKVLVIDEVHAYDAYTSGLIRELIRRTAALGGTVLLLSATLTAKEKAFLLGESKMPRETDSPVTVTLKKDGQIRTFTDFGEVRPHRVTFNMLSAADEAVREVVRRVKNGERVLWIENTVDEAQRIYRRLRDLGLNCGLLHSRFRPIDREVNEKFWSDAFGKEPEKYREAAGRVLIGTQVLEQSLDLDADFLVTRLAPMDFLIQRAGRLWRHGTRVRPESCRRAEAWMLCSPESAGERAGDESTFLFGLSGHVYSRYLLSVTKAVLTERLALGETLDLSREARTLLERVYQKPTSFSSSEEEDFYREDEKRRRRLNDLVIGATALDMPAVSEEEAERVLTRIVERPETEVVLLESDWRERLPSEPKERLLWLESRIVKCVRRFERRAFVKPLELKAMNASKRFDRTALCVIGQDGRLRTIEGASPVSKGACFYSRTEGLRYE